MASGWLAILFLCTLASLFIISSAQTCSSFTFTSNRNFESCSDLPYLEAHLHWNYNPSTGKISIAYRARQSSQGWIAWAINPSGAGMIGAQALVAFRNTNGSMTAYPTSITSYNPSMLPASLSFKVSDISAEYSGNEMIIFAVLGPLGNATTVNHVWQAGRSVLSNIPQSHPISQPNLQSIGTVNFQSKRQE